MLRRAHAWDDWQTQDALPRPAALTARAHAVRRPVTALAIALSTAAHAAVFVLLVTRPPSETGVLDFDTDAISVELAASQVLDAIDAEDAVQPQLSSAAVAEGAIPEVASRPPQPDEVKAVEPAPDVATPVPPETAAETLAAIAGAAPAQDPLLEPSAEVPLRPAEQRSETPVMRDAVQREPRPKPVAKPVMKRSDSKSERDVTAGARAVQGSTGAKARISASRGDVAGYAAKVRARVASRRPSGNGARGTVVVSFSVAASGGLSSARIASSSGNARLDSAALQAVRGAGPFPPTPSGGRLSFSVPFHYR